VLAIWQHGAAGNHPERLPDLETARESQPLKVGAQGPAVCAFDMAREFRTLRTYKYTRSRPLAGFSWVGGLMVSARQEPIPRPEFGLTRLDMLGN
jgi:hypothetical protein